MKATGIVRRIDDLGRVVIPKEIRRTMRIREGDPLEIYTTRDGEVIFKKYSVVGSMEEFAQKLCDALGATTAFIAAVADRDTLIAASGAGRRKLPGVPLSDTFKRIMDNRSLYLCDGQGPAPIISSPAEEYTVAVAAPILCEGDVLGLVLLLSPQGNLPGQVEEKLAQTAAVFLGKHMES